MAMVDPFAESIENDIPGPPVVEDPPKIEVEKEKPNAGISVTFKFDGDFSAPWIVIHAENTAEALAVTQDPNFKALMDRTATIGRAYGAKLDRTAPTPQGGSQGRPQGNGGGQQQQRRPQGPPPGVEPAWCEHGAMVYKTGNKNGKSWAAWACPGDVKACWNFIN